MRTQLRRITMAAVAVLALATLAEAQTSVRYYLVPKVGTGTFTDPFRPKYVDPGALGAGWMPQGTTWIGMKYGAEDSYILQLNLAVADHTTLAAQPDVIAVPAPITDNVAAGAINTIKSKLEGAHLPSDWVTTSLTYKQVLGVVMRIVQFMQRYSGQTGGERFFDLVDKNGVAITLDTTFQQLTAAEKTKLQSVAASFNLDTSGITASSTIRAILKNVADQMFPPDTIIFGADRF